MLNASLNLRSFKFAQVIFCVRLVCLIELLTINAFKVSIFYQQILQYLSKLKGDLQSDLRMCTKEPTFYDTSMFWVLNYVLGS